MSEPTSRGTCFGFDVRSSLDFSLLRPGSAGDPLTVFELGSTPEPAGEPVCKWDPETGQPFRARLYADDGAGYRLWIEGGGWFVVDPSRSRIGVPPGVQPLRREERLWGLPSLLAFTHRGDLPLHAASVAVDDKAIVLAGPSRHGKTSLAAAFLADGHQMLSGDLTCVRIRGDGASIIPGPAGMRVRHDMVGQLDRAAVTELFRDADRAHFSLNPERRRTSSPVTLAGVVFLIDEAPEVALERLDPMRALPNLWHLSFHLPTQSERERKLRNLTDLAELAPAWELRRPWKVEALPQTVAGIVSTVIA